MAETSSHDPSAPETEEAATARELANMRSRRPLRAAIERLVAKTHPKQVACLGAGLLHDVPDRALERGGASVHLVDQVLGNVERGIAQSIIAIGEDGRPECVYCTLNEGAATEITEGEVCPDDEKSGPIRPSVAVWMPNPLPYGQKLVSTFPEPPLSAIIGPSLRSHPGNVGLPHQLWGTGGRTSLERRGGEDRRGPRCRNRDCGNFSRSR